MTMDQKNIVIRASGAGKGGHSSAHGSSVETVSEGYTQEAQRRPPTGGNTGVVDGCPQENDTTILVLGATGVGKSTFINALTGSEITVVDHGMNPCTRDTKPFTVQHPIDSTRRVTLIDTPGFSDTWGDGRDILERIIEELSSLKEGLEITGIIYLQEITHRTITEADRSMLFGLCRPGLLEHVVLVTTKWGQIKSEDGHRREQLLLDADWKKMAEKGSQKARFMDTQASAWEIVNLVQKIRAEKSSASQEPPGVLAHFAKAWNISLSELARPRSRNIVIFGETGAGKSSLVNMIIGSSEAPTSHKAAACTLSAKCYDVTIDSQLYRIYDTVGLEEPKKLEQKRHHLDAIENAYRLVTSLADAGGIHLLVFCFRAGRLTEAARRTYLLFNDFICNSQVPVVLVITHLEQHLPMESWWNDSDNQREFSSCGIRPGSCVCVTTIPGQEDDLRQRQKYEDSRKRVHELLQKHGGGAQGTLFKDRAGWTATIIQKLGEMLEKMRIRPPRHSKKSMVQFLTQKDLMSREEAELLAERLTTGTVVDLVKDESAK